MICQVLISFQTWCSTCSVDAIGISRYDCVQEHSAFWGHAWKYAPRDCENALQLGFLRVSTKLELSRCRVQHVARFKMCGICCNSCGWLPDSSRFAEGARWCLSLLRALLISQATCSWSVSFSNLCWHALVQISLSRVSVSRFHCGFTLIGVS